MSSIKINKVQAAQLCYNHKTSHIFSVIFVKRTTGKLRKMVCRKRVKPGPGGSGRNFNVLAKGLISVYDMQASGHRFISTEDIREVKMEGQHYIVK